MDNNTSEYDRHAIKLKVFFYSLYFIHKHFPLVVAATCKCPPIIYSNFFDSEPYVKYNRREQSITGLIPHILKMITNKVCTGTCNSYNHSTFYFDRTFSGDPAAKNTEVGVRKTIGQSAHINFPLRGFSTMKKLQGYHPFISLVQFQGTAYIVFHESVKSVGFMGIFMAIFNAWSIIAMGCLLAYLCGCCYWFTVLLHVLFTLLWSQLVHNLTTTLCSIVVVV